MHNFWTSFFTLTEALVTMAIFALLASFFTPTIKQALEQSRRITCSNNLRQQVFAALTYSDDFRLPPAGTTIDSPQDNGDANGFLSSNNAFGRTTAWWVFVEEQKYLERHFAGCPSMDQPIHHFYELDIYPGGINWAPKRYSYSYRYNFATIPGSKNSGYFVANAFEKFSERSLFSDAAGYRRTAYRVFEKTTYPTRNRAGYNRFRWAHQEGGNVATFDGRVAFIRNNATAPYFNWSWPNQSHTMPFSKPSPTSTARGTIDQILSAHDQNSL